MNAEQLEPDWQLVNEGLAETPPKVDPLVDYLFSRQDHRSALVEQLSCWIELTGDSSVWAEARLQAIDRLQKDVPLSAIGLHLGECERTVYRYLRWEEEGPPPVQELLRYLKSARGLQEIITFLKRNSRLVFKKSQKAVSGPAVLGWLGMLVNQGQITELRRGKRTLWRVPAESEGL